MSSVEGEHKSSKKNKNKCKNVIKDIYGKHKVNGDNDCNKKRTS